MKQEVEIEQTKTAVVVIHGIHPTARFEIQDLFGTQLHRRLNEMPSGHKWKLNILWPKIAKPNADPGDVHATALRVCERADNADDPKRSYFDVFEAYWSPIDKNQTTVGKMLAWLADGIFVPLNASARLYSSFWKVAFDLILVVAVLVMSLAFLLAAIWAADWGYNIFSYAAACALNNYAPQCGTGVPSLFDFTLHPISSLQKFAWPAIAYVAILFIGAYAATQLAISLYHTCAEFYRRKRVSRTAPGVLEPHRLWRVWFMALLAIVVGFALGWWPWFRPFVPDPTHRLLWGTLTVVAIVGFFRAALGTLNEFFVNTLGDVQIYTTHDENSAFYKFRKEIVELVEGVILQVLRAESGTQVTMEVQDRKYFIRPPDAPPPTPLYDRVVIAAHSLGSTIGMDALLSIHELTQEGGVTSEQWNRLRAFVTFGSSLEKTKFFFDVKQPTVSASADHWRSDVYGKLFTENFKFISSGDATPMFWANHWYFTDLVANHIESYTEGPTTQICENTRLGSKFSLWHPWVHSDYLWDENFWRRPDDSKTHGMLDVLLLD